MLLLVMRIVKLFPRSHLGHLSTRVPGVDVKNAPGETTELVFTVEYLDRVATSNAFPLQVLVLASSKVVVTSIGITPTDPVVRVGIDHVPR